MVGFMVGSLSFRCTWVILFVYTQIVYMITFKISVTILRSSEYLLHGMPLTCQKVGKTRYYFATRSRGLGFRLIKGHICGCNHTIQGHT